jgi:hypothetical protein
MVEWISSEHWWNETDREREVWSTRNKHLSCWHFVHHRSHIGFLWDWTQTSVVRGSWLNCVSHGAVFLEVTLCALVGRSHHFRWHYREDGDVRTRLYGVTSQEALILTCLQCPHRGAVAFCIAAKVMLYFEDCWTGLICGISLKQYCCYVSGLCFSVPAGVSTPPR